MARLFFEGRMLRPTGGAARADAPADDPVRGIVLVVSSMIIFSVSDATAKYLSASLPPIEIAWLRYGTFLLILLPSILRHGSASLRSHRPGLQLARGLGLLTSSVLFIFAVSAMPMADATATSFVSPLFTTALSIPFLGEKVGVRRWAAVVIGLVGMLIIVRPGTTAFHPASMFPLCSALAWSLAMVITRKMSGADSTVVMLVYAAGIGFLVLSAALPLVWVPPSVAEVALGVFIGLASTTGQWLVVCAYRRATASLLAPFSYTQLVWSSFLGFVVFGGLPDGMTLLGAAIIVLSGLYTVHRERVARGEH